MVVVFSPGRKAFSFGHPSVDTLINRFLGVDLAFGHARTGGEPSENDQPSDALSIVNKEITLLNNRLEVEKKRNEELLKLRQFESKDTISWWLASIDQLEVSQLKQLLWPIAELRDNVARLGEKLRAQETKGANPSLPFSRGHHMGSSYHFPPSMVEGQSSLGGQSSRIQSPSEHPQLPMAPTPMVNPMGMGGYFDPNVPNPFGFGGHLNGSAKPSLNMGTNAKSFTSMLTASNPMDPPPSDIQDRLGFRLGL